MRINFISLQMLSLCPHRSPTCTMSPVNLISAFSQTSGHTEKPYKQGNCNRFSHLLLGTTQNDCLVEEFSSSHFPFFSHLQCMQNGKITFLHTFNKEPKQVKYASVLNPFILHITTWTCALNKIVQHLWVSHFWFISNIDIIYPLSSLKHGIHGQHLFFQKTASKCSW